MSNGITSALHGLSGTAERLIGSIPDRAYNQGKLGLESARLEGELGSRALQDRAATLSIEGSEIDLRTKRAVEEKALKPFHVPSYYQEQMAAGKSQESANIEFTDPDTNDLITESKLSELKFVSDLIPKLGTIFEAEYDPVSGYYKRKDGTIVNNRDIELNTEAIQILMGTQTDGEKYLQMKADGGDAEAAKLLANKATPEGEIAFLKHQFEQKLALVKNIGNLNLPEKTLKIAMAGIKRTKDQYDSAVTNLQKAAETKDKKSLREIQKFKAVKDIMEPSGSTKTEIDRITKEKSKFKNRLDSLERRDPKIMAEIAENLNEEEFKRYSEELKKSPKQAMNWLSQNERGKINAIIANYDQSLIELEKNWSSQIQSISQLLGVKGPRSGQQAPGTTAGVTPTVQPSGQPKPSPPLPTLTPKQKGKPVEDKINIISHMAGTGYPRSNEAVKEFIKEHPDKLEELRQALLASQPEPSSPANPQWKKNMEDLLKAQGAVVKGLQGFKQMFQPK